MLQEFSFEAFEKRKAELAAACTFIDRYTNQSKLKFYLFRYETIFEKPHTCSAQLFLALPKYFNASLCSVPEIRFEFIADKRLIRICDHCEMKTYLSSYGYIPFLDWLNGDAFSDYEKSGHETGLHHVPFWKLRFYPRYECGNLIIPEPFSSDNEERLRLIGERELLRAFYEAECRLQISDTAIEEICFIPARFTASLWRMVHEQGFIEDNRITQKGIEHYRELAGSKKPDNTGT